MQEPVPAKSETRPLEKCMGTRFLQVGKPVPREKSIFFGKIIRGTRFLPRDNPVPEFKNAQFYNFTHWNPVPPYAGTGSCDSQSQKCSLTATVFQNQFSSFLKRTHTFQHRKITQSHPFTYNLTHSIHHYRS